MISSLIAYVDPASGSILVQLLLGGIIGIGVFCRRQIAWFGRLFRGPRSG